MTLYLAIATSHTICTIFSQLIVTLSYIPLLCLVYFSLHLYLNPQSLESNCEELSHFTEFEIDGSSSFKCTQLKFAEFVFVTVHASGPVCYFIFVIPRAHCWSPLQSRGSLLPALHLALGVSFYCYRNLCVQSTELAAVARFMASVGNQPPQPLPVRRGAQGVSHCRSCHCCQACCFLRDWRLLLI